MRELEHHDEVNMTAFEIRAITAEEARTIRGPILRPHLPPDRTIFTGDDWPDTFHAGAFQGDRLVGIVTIIHQPPPGSEDPALWRLRGMATLPEARGKGCGAKLVRICLRYVAEQGGTMLWCDARESAIGFYLKLGFEVRSGKYQTESGMHYQMWRALTPSDKLPVE
jgi:ribosomal protein S18 acetylase RimI-like enzyme